MSVNDWITVLTISWFVIGFVIGIGLCLVTDNEVTIGDLLMCILISAMGWLMIPLGIVFLITRSKWKDKVIWSRYKK